jgi:hypothetical protein
LHARWLPFGSKECSQKANKVFCFRQIANTDRTYYVKTPVADTERKKKETKNGKNGKKTTGLRIK